MLEFDGSKFVQVKTNTLSNQVKPNILLKKSNKGGAK